MNNIEAMKLALDALEMSYELDDTGFANFEKYGLKKDKDITKKLLEAIAALRQAISEAEQITPPPECVTENEKRAFAYGWFKALEKTR